MAVPEAGEFWATLIRLGLLDPAIAKSLAQQVSAQADAATDPALAAAKFLIAQGVLTKFQAKRLLAQRGGELRQGEYLVLDRCEQPPLSRWLRARHLPTGTLALVYPCSAAQDAKQPVDPRWLRPHLAVAADGLQPLAAVQLAGAAGDDASWRGLVVSSLPDGQTLTTWLKSRGPLDASGVLAFGQVLGGALTAMHAAGLVHGGIRPGRIWIGDDTTVYLLRSGGGPPIAPDSLPPPAYDWFDDDGLAADFASPQWLSGQVHASVLDDVYSLGAVLYTSLSGKPVVTGTLPAELSAAVAAGAAGDPLLRVLAAAMAPDPANRFTDVPSLLRALDAVAALRGQPSPSPPQAEPEPQPTPAALQTSTPQATSASQPTSGAQPSATAESQPGTSPHWISADEAAAPAEPQRVQPQIPPASKPSSAPKSSTSRREAPAAVAPVAEHQPQAAERNTPSTPPGQTPAADTVVSPQPAAVQPTKPIPKPVPNKPVPKKSASPGKPQPVPAQSVAVAPQPKENAPLQLVTATAPAVGEPQTAPKPTAKPAPRRRKRTRRNRRGPIIIGSASVAVLLLLVGVLLRSMSGDGQPSERPAVRPLPQPGGLAQGGASGASAAGTATTRDAGPTTATPAGQASTGGYELVQDDRLLWASPWPATASPPPLDLVTPGAQVIVALRPSELLRSDSAADWRGWFGPELEPLLQSLQQRCGVPPEQIQRLVVSLLPGRDGEPSISLAVWLAEPVDRDTLLQRWNVEASRTADGQTIYSGDGADAYFIAGNSTGEQVVAAFAVGSVEHMRLVAEGGGGPIPLPRSLELAWGQSSDQADVVALVSPNFLFADGRGLLQRYAPNAIATLRDLLIPDVTAALVMLDTTEAWYGELRLVPGGAASPAALLRTLQTRTTELPGLGETFVVQHDVPASWRALAIRLPQYLRAIEEQTRFGISQTLPTANFYLPAEAAPQVALASLLALSSGGATVAVGGSTAGAMPGATNAPVPLSIDQLLNTPLSISFDQESLETAIAMIGEEFVRTLPEGAPRLQLTIIGGDLEKSGITQNQQIRDFQMRDIPLRKVLTQLVLGANPDKTATGPADPKQSLIWVVDPAATPETPALLITTRPQAEAKGYTLPQEFTES